MQPWFIDKFWHTFTRQIWILQCFNCQLSIQLSNLQIADTLLLCIRDTFCTPNYSMQSAWTHIWHTKVLWVEIMTLATLTISACPTSTCSGTIYMKLDNMDSIVHKSRCSLAALTWSSPVRAVTHTSACITNTKLHCRYNYDIVYTVMIIGNRCWSVRKVRDLSNTEEVCLHKAWNLQNEMQCTLTWLYMYG